MVRVPILKIYGNKYIIILKTDKGMKQLTSHILMIRPSNFGFNEQTASNNSFQSTGSIDNNELRVIAQNEFDDMVNHLQSKGIHTHIIEDTALPVKPDAVFPNNWISTHENGTLITYPMFAPNRRIERREDIIESLEDKFKMNHRYSFEFYEEEDEPMFLEGTGSLIFDRPNSLVYACTSQRTDIRLIDKFNVLMGTQSIVFRALDSQGNDIYHTNVMMALGLDFVVICMESIPDESSRKRLVNSFNLTGKEIIEISLSQVESFAGNMLEVENNKGDRFLCLSQKAFDVLTDSQKQKLSDKTTLLPIPITHIEKYGGGSVRCMMCEIFLPLKTKK